MLQSTYAPRGAVDLRQTLGHIGRGAHDPTVRWHDGSVWITMRPDGPDAEASATLHLTTTADGVHARAWGDAAEAAIDAVPRLLGADDDWSEFDRMLQTGPARHEALAEVRRRTPGLRLARTDRLWAALAHAVIEQKVTALEALASWRRLVTRFGEPPPGPAPEGMRVIPTAAAWRRIPSWEWHRAGVGPERSATIVRASGLAASLERGVGMDAGTAAIRLQTVRGIGVWTAAETVQRSHGDPDHVSVGDYHLAATIGWALSGAPVDDDGMLELLEPWRGHRQRIVRLIGVSGFRKPAFGPRMTVQDHRGH